MAGAANQKRWDECVVAALYVGLIAWNVVIPFDPKRYGWSRDFPLWMKALGGGALLASSSRLFRPYTDNTLIQRGWASARTDGDLRRRSMVDSSGLC